MLPLLGNRDRRCQGAHPQFLSSLWPTSVITLRVCSLGVATVGLIEALAGSWVSLLGIRRRLYSAMEIIFEPLGIPDQKAIIRLSPELKSELLCLVVRGSLAVVNLRAKPSSFIVATDASMDAMAGVVADVDPAVVKEITRFSLKKGNGSRLLPAAAAWEKSHGLLDAADELRGSRRSTSRSTSTYWNFRAISLRRSDSPIGAALCASRWE